MLLVFYQKHIVLSKEVLNAMNVVGKGKFSVLTDRKIRSFIVLQLLYNGFVGILTLFINTFIMKA